jgi:2-keto-3-deoxy-L-rhamnonate aldolase RhmA
MGTIREFRKLTVQGHRSLTMFTAVSQYQTTIGHAAVSQVVNDTVLIMPMVETVEGLENVE